MAIRTNRLIGKAWGDSATPATVTVEFNGVQVFNGTVPEQVPVPRTPDILDQDSDIVCTWETDSSVAGENIPVKITVNGLGEPGVLNVWAITMNHIQAGISKALRAEAVWPGYKPASIEEFEQDILLLDDQQFFDRYSAPKDGLHPDSIKYVNREYIITVPIENNFITSVGANPDGTRMYDAKRNIRINGVERLIEREQGQEGNLPIDIQDGDVLEFDLFVSPPRLNPTYAS